ncbi:hypothetical protein V3C99_000711 [Haemonchus contortus]
MFVTLICAVLFSSSAIALPALRQPPRFSDEFARTKVVTLCAATQLDDPQICLRHTFTNTTVLHKITTQCDKIPTDTCSGYTAINHADKAIILVFRGTIGENQLVLESEVTVFEKMTAWVAGGTVSSYFYNAFFSVWNGGIKDDFLTLANKYKGYELWIVGHSLGGAMASLAASYIEKVKLYDGNLIKLVTFGQPRTGDNVFAKAHDAQIPYSYRVVHAHDIVPQSPPDGYRNYRHHKSEVWYNNNMTTADYVVCYADESMTCSDQVPLLDLTFRDHHRYYNVYISEWGAANCTGDPANPPPMPWL